MPKKVPHTLESLREKDETMLANVEDEEKDEVCLYFFYVTYYFVYYPEFIYYKYQTLNDFTLVCMKLS